MNKINVNGLSAFTAADNELRKAAEAFETGNHGKARVCARRAVGYVAEFYLQTHRELLPLYGRSFMNNLRGIAADENVPDEVRSCAEKLIVHPEFDEIKGDEAINLANKIIAYFKGKISS